eukprot:m.17230 g.17230  ORF g.17230 m.17230 type:complete len:81 (+) comp11169_c0_seq1:93-335(+)
MLSSMNTLLGSSLSCFRTKANMIATHALLPLYVPDGNVIFNKYFRNRVLDVREETSIALEYLYTSSSAGISDHVVAGNAS